MQFVSLVSILVLASLSVCAQPRIVTVDTVHWGRVIPRGSTPGEQKITSRVAIQNAGTQNLVVTNVRPQCGCTTAPLDSHIIAPGDSTMMTVTINLPLGSGLFSKYVSIESNDPLTPVRPIYLIADVQRPLQLSSSFIPFNTGSVGDTIEGRISVTLLADTTITVQIVEPSKGLLIKTPNSIELRQNDVVELIVAIIPRQPGPFRAEAVIKTSLPGYESIPVHGFGSTR